MEDTFKTPAILSNHQSFLQKFSLTVTQRDLIAGSLSGLIIVASGHPLDTIKVRMQMMGTGFLTTCVNLVKKEGVLALYKGLKSPLYSIPLTTSIHFLAYESATRFQGLKRGDKRSTKVSFLSGAWSGFVYGFIITPIDLLKNRLQMEGVGEQGKSTKLSIMARNIFKKDGYLGLFKGLGATWARDIPACALQFVIYENVKEALNQRFGESSLSSFFAGGLSVLCAWTSTYHQDTLKTKIQCSTEKLKIRDCAKEIYRSSGIKGFWKGLSPCILRAIVTGSARFMVFDHCQKFIRKNDLHLENFQ